MLVSLEQNGHKVVVDVFLAQAVWYTLGHPRLLQDLTVSKTKHPVNSEWGREPSTSNHQQCEPRVSAGFEQMIHVENTGFEADRDLAG